jgi:hypothetical protein
MGVVRARSVMYVSLLGVVAALVVALVTGPLSQADNGASSSIPAIAGTPTVNAGVEVPSLRTAVSRTYRRSDGSFRSVISAGPMNFRDASGVWQPIDTRLKSDGAGGLQTTAAATQVALPAGLDDPAKMSSAAGWVGVPPL